MFKAIGAGAGRTPGHQVSLPRFGFFLGIFFCLIFWAVAHYEFGFYPARQHYKGGRMYPVDSYEQFMRQKMGEGSMVLAA
jgi:hypothetical protein